MRIACLDGRPAAVEGERAYDLTGMLPHASCFSTSRERMIALIRAWPDVEAAVRSRGLAGLPLLDPAACRWEAPVPRPGKVVGAPVNYRAHGREMGVEATVEGQSVFLKAGSSVIGPFADIVLPLAGRQTDQEGELAAVIGREVRGVPVEDALGAVFGYTCLVDATLRGPEERSARKSFDTFTPMGPWITTADEVPDPGALRLRCWVNGALRQDASTADLIFGVARLVAHTSEIMTLEPGDVLATGTPAGVGSLAPGDRVVVEIERLGRLEVGVKAGPAWSRAIAPPLGRTAG